MPPPMARAWLVARQPLAFLGTVWFVLHSTGTLYMNSGPAPNTTDSSGCKGPFSEEVGQWRVCWTCVCVCVCVCM